MEIAAMKRRASREHDRGDVRGEHMAVGRRTELPRSEALGESRQDNQIELSPRSTAAA
jgi:hypothetical protein